MLSPMLSRLAGLPPLVHALCAVLLWSTVATLSVTLRDVPPFLLVGTTLLIGSLVSVHRIREWRAPWRVLALGVYGLFAYHFALFVALRRAPAIEANLINYLWPLLIVLLSAPLAGERLGWTHLLGALLGFAGVVLLAFGRGLDFAGGYTLGYLLALGCAFAWSLYSVLSRRFGETPTDAIAAFCAASALLSLVCHLLFETTVWPAGLQAWLAVLALGLGPAGAAFYLWDHAVKRGDIRALGAASYATPILSTGLLILCGLAQPTSTLLIAALLVTVGAVLASREMWKR